MFEVEKNAAPTVAKMLLGNKSDLTTKKVTKEDGMGYAERNKMMFLETSAKKDFQVSTAFEQISRKLVEGRYLHIIHRMEKPVETKTGIDINNKISVGVQSMKDKLQQCCQ